jgi:glutathionyl-hydroquinone reductase
VHFVGHSAGAQVVRVLHHMFTDKVHKQEIFRFYSQVIAVYCYLWN